MTHSFAHNQTLTCTHCQQDFQAEIWQIVNIEERPDLVKRIKTGSLHLLDCPYCRSENPVNAPLLIYQPGNEPKLVFSPQDGITQAQDREIFTKLVGHLEHSLGAAWRDDWLEDLVLLPKAALPFLLREGLAAAQDYMRERRAASQEETKQLYDLVLAFIQADNWDESRRMVEEHPELLTDNALKIMASLIEQAHQKEDQQAERIFEQHRTLLQRCRDVGITLLLARSPVQMEKRV
jgi:hypothetical protein